MRYSIYTLFASAALAATLFGACSEVPEDDRFIDNPRPQIQKKVAIFEFTGQRCTNCPEGAAVVHSLQETFPGQVFAVNLHPENTQFTIPLGNIQLTSPAATFLYQQFKPGAFPAACIDLTAPVTNTMQWSSLVRTALEQPSPATLLLNSDYNPDSRELTVEWSAEFNQYTTQEMYIQLYLVEDGIVGFQIANGKPVADYVHNHVLRNTFYPEWGLAIGNSFEIGDNPQDAATITLDQGWVPENCQVIACLLDASHIVRQAEAIDAIYSETDTNQ